MKRIRFGWLIAVLLITPVAALSAQSSQAQMVRSPFRVAQLVLYSWTNRTPIGLVVPPQRFPPPPCSPRDGAPKSCEANSS